MQRRWTHVMMLAALALLMVSGVVAKKSFKYRTYGGMAAYLQELNATYPDVIRVFIAQEKYNLPYPKELTCVEDDETQKLVPCKHFVVHLTNHSTLDTHPERPEVFFSGALHGDERIGPITTMELIALVGKYTSAYSNLTQSIGSLSPEEATIQRNTQRWVQHLINTRSVFITPMTNAYGYAHDTREELNVDPNRDYNYMRSGSHCMQTMTSRVVNEIWREHIFQLAVTYHGGMRAISYEWGSPNHYLPNNPHRSEKCPDHKAQLQIANSLSTFGGAFADGSNYPTGTMNDIVYGVTGGMEDWGYAASWENQFVGAGDADTPEIDKPFKPCEPKTFGGYDPSKTVYNNITHRAFNILVETSNNKHPGEDELGFFEDIYASELDFYRVKKDFKVGHVTRNVRLALMLMDLVQPYLRWVHTPLNASATQEISDARDAFISASLFVDDPQQLEPLGCPADSLATAQVETCTSAKCHIKYDGVKPLKLQVSWEVLGALTVDETKIQVSSSPDFADSDIVFESPVQKGSTRRYFDLPDSLQANEGTPGISLFTSCVDLRAQNSKKFYVRAMAMVDQDWKNQGAKEDAPSPHIPPQSHLVNARTNPGWKKVWNGHRVQGSVYWYSPVVHVNVEAIPATTPPPPPATSSPPLSVTPSPVPSTADASEVTPTQEPAIESSGSGVDDDETTPTATSVATPSVAPASAAPTPSVAPTIAPVATPSKTPSDQDETNDDVDGADDQEDATPAPTASATPVPSSEAPDSDDEGEGEGETNDDNEGFADDQDEEEEPTPTSSAPSTRSPVPSTSASAPTPIQTSDATASLSQKAVGNQSSGPSLLNYGYLVLSIGGIVIIMAVTYLYRRVFRSKRRAYMNINQQPQHTTRAMHNRVRQGEDDMLDEDEDSV
ncbi:hypothetical protein Poli38472_002518 [Pythium oligandrum]|uniref:Peptidase M14 domain-containing protein n=1 Tax=Pythium oligandrum TaxID=41045 RepID=A0A8K1CHN6_PYTOL|nr:hypothetical protein Poli38472_002518 [Pythium oligandrum]|eukprot:TMW63577.1 hypothetical protein Poli38472_002518 [Pythium oligandrum]